MCPERQGAVPMQSKGEAVSATPRVRCGSGVTVGLCVFLAPSGIGPTAKPGAAHGRAEGAAPQPGYVQQGESTVRRKIIVRVPVHRQGPRLKWTEKKKS